jgi:hypothetical protein
MHVEQHKCKLRRLPIMSRGADLDPAYKHFSANLHSAKLNLLPHMVFTAVMDACRGVKSGIKTAAATRASRR